MKQYANILTDLLYISEKRFPEQNKQITEKAKTLFAEYCKQEEGKTKEITMHTVRKILPCIAFYKAVIECIGQQGQAYSILPKYVKSMLKNCRNYAVSHLHTDLFCVLWQV